ncbi:neuronal acetylcholine receptor subunit alpha-7-like [Saccostrea echinata]|uniref:neuronal acetylcholine receptor subunit alpha-7-like n=1 Tax=Saccostrea echinata TaxID=191078 RepID=UPI002A83151A|nr:neuronal acetylcholine receptor subunit alpha-7-like [Saccostrea echinata]
MLISVKLFLLQLFTQEIIARNRTAFSLKLVNDLLKNYDPRVLPVTTPKENVSIAVNIALRQLMKLDEKNQVITLNIWMRLWWNDPFLSWDIKEYGNITQIILPYSNVWTPDITLFDSASEEMMPGHKEYRPIVHHNGSVNYLFSTILDSVCRINVRYFPIDTQVCPLKFASWSYSGVDLDFYPKTQSVDMEYYITHNEWEVTSAHVKRNTVFYKCCPEPFPDVTFYLKIRRKPFFYIVSVLFPCMLTSSIATLGFLLPPESGEKISLNVTVLLSLAVFLLMVTDQLPASSEHFPYVGMYMASLMSLVALSLLMTVVVLNVHFRKTFGNRVSPWMRWIFIHHLGCLCRSPIRKTLRKKYGNNKYGDKNKNEYTGNECKILCDSEIYLKNTTRELQTEVDVRHIGNPADRTGEDLSYDIQQNVNDINEWQEVAIIMDRLFLIIFIAFSITPTVLFLSLMTSG